MSLDAREAKTADEQLSDHSDPAPTEQRERRAAPRDLAESDVADRPQQHQTQKESDAEVEEKPSFFHRHPALVVAGAIALLIAALASYLYWDNSSRFESTDDAFVAARQYSIAPKVSGYVVDIPVTDNAHVAPGDVIAQIDPRDYNIALAQADAAVVAARAGVADAEAQIAVQKAQIDASRAKVAQTQASLKFATAQAGRYQNLAKSGSGTVQNAQQFEAQQQEQQAGLDSAIAAVTVAAKQLDAAEAQRRSAQAKLAQANAQKSQAELNLSYATVRASEPGRVVQLTAAKGQLAQAGSALATFVPDHVWVTANFKETDLDRLRPGQPADVRIDAYPERAITGHVASVQPGSGTAFSLSLIHISEPTRRS